MSNGRFFVYFENGGKFCVEPVGHNHVEWGNIVPGSKKIEKVTAKDSGIVEESIITSENGFRNICTLAPGVSPLSYLEQLVNSKVERIDSPEITYE